MKTKSRSLLLTLLVMLLWGSLYPTVKLSFQAYRITTTGDILLFAGVRFAISGALICLWQFFFHRQVFLTARSNVLPILLSGLFAIVLHYSFNYLGLRYTDSSKTALMKQIGPLFYICLSFLFFREDRLTLRKLFAALIGFTGILVINPDQCGLQFGLGEALVLLASLCTTFSNIVSKRALQQVHPIVLTGLSQLSGGLALLFLGIISGGTIQFSIQQSGIMAYILLSTVFSYCLWFSIVRKENLSRLFIVKFAEPIFACLIGAFLLGENILELKYLVAFLLIASGVCLAR